jgi:hypothetical protein
MDRNRIHGTHDNPSGELERLQCLGPDHTGAIHWLTDDGMLLEDGDLKPTRGQPLGGRRPGRTGPHHENIVGCLHRRKTLARFRHVAR